MSDLVYNSQTRSLMQGKRRFIRISVRRFLKYRILDDDTDRFGVVINISRGGIAFSTDCYIPEDTILFIKISSKEGAIANIQAVGKIVWGGDSKKRENLYGVEFLNVIGGEKKAGSGWKALAKAYNDFGKKMQKPFEGHEIHDNGIKEMGEIPSDFNDLIFMLENGDDYSNIVPLINKIGISGNKDAIPLLKEIIKHKNRIIKEAARLALNRLLDIKELKKPKII